jgi:hypothetical protein
VNIKMIQTSVERLVTENATLILTASGAVGTVATGVLAWRGGYQTGHKIWREEEQRRFDSIPPGVGEGEPGEVLELKPLTTKDKVILALPHAAPPVVTGGLGIAAIVLSHRMSAQKAAALAAAYGLSRDQFEEYRAKVAEKLTGPKTQAIDDEIAQDRVNRTPGSDQVVIVGTGNVLFFDEPNGRYFESTVEKVRQVVNHVNEQIYHHDAVSANHFYGELGLPETKWGSEVGWNMDNNLEVRFSTTMADDQRPCVTMDFVRQPTADFQDRNY